MAVRLFHNLLEQGLTPFVYHFLRLYLSTLKVKVINQEMALGHLAKGGTAIVAVWHQRFLSALVYASRFKYLRPCVMISQSRDGDLISPIVERLGLVPIRGSSSKGGRNAAAAFLAGLSKNPVAVHIVDGPRGPRGVVKPGTLRLAQLSGAAIFPLHISARAVWIAHSWDRFLIPKPFTQILIRWGQPVFAPKEMGAESLEAMRKDIEKDLLEGHARDDLNWGWKHPL